jgi:hypothetical protein
MTLSSIERESINDFIIHHHPPTTTTAADLEQMIFIYHCSLLKRRGRRTMYRESRFTKKQEQKFPTLNQKQTNVIAIYTYIYILTQGYAPVRTGERMREQNGDAAVPRSTSTLNK